MRVPGVTLYNANRPRPVSQKISEDSVKNRPCLSNEVASLDDLAVRALIFWAKQAQSWLFFVSFFCVKTKKWKDIQSRHSLDFFCFDQDKKMKSNLRQQLPLFCLFTNELPTKNALRAFIICIGIRYCCFSILGYFQDHTLSLAIYRLDLNCVVLLDLEVPTSLPFAMVVRSRNFYPAIFMGLPTCWVSRPKKHLSLFKHQSDICCDIIWNTGRKAQLIDVQTTGYKHVWQH